MPAKPNETLIAMVSGFAKAGLTEAEIMKQTGLTKGQVAGIRRRNAIPSTHKTCRPVVPAYLSRPEVAPEPRSVVRQWGHAALRLAEFDPAIRRSLERFPCANT